VCIMQYTEVVLNKDWFVKLPGGLGSGHTISQILYNTADLGSNDKSGIDANGLTNHPCTILHYFDRLVNI
jgi:hypothetical protein